MEGKLASHLHPGLKAGEIQGNSNELVSVLKK